jgi:hypothetical protein
MLLNSISPAQLRFGGLNHGADRTPTTARELPAGTIVVRDAQTWPGTHVWAAVLLVSALSRSIWTSRAGANIEATWIRQQYRLTTESLWMRSSSRWT